MPTNAPSNVQPCHQLFNILLLTVTFIQFFNINILVILLLLTNSSKSTFRTCVGTNHRNLHILHDSQVKSLTHPWLVQFLPLVCIFQKIDTLHHYLLFY